jgi:hypothetical protein
MRVLELAEDCLKGSKLRTRVGRTPLRGYSAFGLALGIPFGVPSGRRRQAPAFNADRMSALVGAVGAKRPVCDGLSPR